ncbi:MAG: hypothetical protein HY078_05080 [Elusimicrobia bacterium]|nr:hypothetical protein [Elusimicrobiota bacterium]
MNVLLAFLLLVPAYLSLNFLAMAVFALYYSTTRGAILPMLFIIHVLAILSGYFGWVVYKGVLMAGRLTNGEMTARAAWGLSWDSPTWVGAASTVLMVGLCVQAIRQFQVVHERARVSEAQAMAATIKQSQERRFAKAGDYVTRNEDAGLLDVAFGGRPPSFGMRSFEASLQPTSAGCAGKAGYRILFKRVSAQVGLAKRYGAYSMVYDGCTDRWSWSGCDKCERDLGG